MKSIIIVVLFAMIGAVYAVNTPTYPSNCYFSVVNDNDGVCFLYFSIYLFPFLLSVILLYFSVFLLYVIYYLINLFVQVWWMVDPNGKTFWTRGFDVLNPNGEQDITTKKSLYKDTVIAKYLFFIHILLYKIFYLFIFEIDHIWQLAQLVRPSSREIS